MLLAIIPPPPFSGLELGPLNIRMYGILIAVGAYLGLRLVVSRYERFGGDPEVAERSALLALLGGLIGARIGYIIPRFERFAEDPLSAFVIWEGGLTFFGGLAGGAAAVLVYLRRRGGHLPSMADAVAPALPLAQAVGRWGNYFNQELYGRPTDLPWALEVEPPYRRPGFEDEATFHPTFLYESLWNLLLVAVLLRIDRTGRLRRGALIFAYLIGYGIGRAWIEALRVDTDARYLGLSRNNWIALLVIALGAAGLWWWQQRRPATADRSPTGATDDPAGDEQAGVEQAGDGPADDEQAGGSHAVDDPTDGPVAGGQATEGPATGDPATGDPASDDDRDR